MNDETWQGMVISSSKIEDSAGVLSGKSYMIQLTDRGKREREIM